MDSRRSIWCLVAAALFSSLVSSDSTTSITSGPVNWTTCPSSISTNLKCADIIVPLDYNKPSEETLSLKLLKLPTNNTSNRRGSVVWQYGGPGDTTASDLILAANGGFDNFAEIRHSFDIVVADPRGVGINSAIKCDPKFGEVKQKFYPRSEDEYKEAIEFYRELGQSCLDRTGNLLHHLDTLTQAKDLEAVRLAIGEGALNYYGLSWGTIRGSTYAQLYPRNIRAMVLDAVADHSVNATTFAGSESQSYSLVQRRMLEWMGTNSSSALYGRDAVTLFHNLVKRADKSPLPAPACVGSDECFSEVTGDDIRNASFYPANYLKWAKFSQDIKEAADNNNASAMAAQISHSETSVLYSMLGIVCQDWDFNLSWPEYQRKQFMTSAFSLDGSSTLGERTWGIACQGWPTNVTNPPRPMTVKNPSAPIMLVNALWDPATSYDGMLNVHSQIEGSVVLTRYGEGHGSLPSSAARKVMYDYLTDVKVPDTNELLVDHPMSSEETEFEMQGWGRSM